MREQFYHHTVVTRNLVLETLHTDDGEDFFGVHWESDSLFRVVHVEDLILLSLRLHWVLKAALLGNLLALKGLLPLVHNPLVFLVHVVLVGDGLHRLLVELTEILTETGLRDSRLEKGRPSLGRLPQQGREELVALL